MGGDIFVPGTVDESESCNSVNGNFFLTLGGTLSSLCLLYLMWMFFIVKSPILMRHPTALAMFKCIFEFMNVQQFIWLPLVPDSVLFNHYSTTAPFYCRASTLAAFFSFMTQFAFLGNQLWFLVISVDLRRNYTNPFSSYKNDWRNYFRFVVSISLLSAIILLLGGNEVYGLSYLGTLWIQDDRMTGRKINYWKLCLYYDFAVIASLYALWATFDLRKFSTKGLPDTLSKRSSIMERSWKYILANLCYDFVIFFITLASYVQSEGSSPVAAVLLSFTGVWSLFVILATNYKDLSYQALTPFVFERTDTEDAENVAIERLLTQPHLNIALRAEILYFTTQGLIFSTRILLRHQTAHTPAANALFNAGPHEVQDDDMRISCFSFNDIALETRESTNVPFREKANVGNVEQEFRSSRLTFTETRDSNMDIFELKRIQERAVSGIVESALETEFSFLGMNIADTTISVDRTSTSIPHFYNEKIKPGNTTDKNPLHSSSNASSALPTKREELINKFLRYGKESIGIISRQSTASHNLKSANTRERGFELNERTSSHKSWSSSFERMQTISVDEAADVRSSNSSQSTVKWRDTMDLEIHMADIVNTTQNSTLKRNTFSQNTDDSKSSDKRSSEFAGVEAERHTISRITAATKQAIQIATDTVQSVFTLSLANDFKFTDYCPKLFATVRELCGISAEMYAKAFESTCRETFSEGRSGAFMFYSSDQRFLVKTTTKGELIALHRCMKKYITFLKENPRSLIVRFVGAHCITMYNVEIYFVVMVNVFPLEGLSERYDLKGSWVNRFGNEGKGTRMSEKKFATISTKSPLFMDNDLRQQISIQPDIARAMAKQIWNDINFLKEQNFMDYSLLIGVKREKFRLFDTFSPQGRVASTCDENDKIYQPMPSSGVESGDGKKAVNGSSEESKRAISIDSDKSNTSRRGNNAFDKSTDGGMQARIVEGPSKYYFGIIDVLQEWNWEKKMERFYKKYFRCLDGDGLSALPPDRYAERFWRRCVLDTFEDLDEDGFVNSICQRESSDVNFFSY